MLTDDEFAVLNGIYLKKMASAATLAEITGLAEARIEECLEAAVGRGQVLGISSDFMLQEGGAADVLEYYRTTYAPVRAEPAVAAWYAAFEALNARFIAQVTEWQKSEGDDRSERRILQTAERLARDLGALQTTVPRYGNYVERLARASDRVDQGQHEFVCKPTIDSVHNIWFEFHEDILAVLGRPRDTT